MVEVGLRVGDCVGVELPVEVPVCDDVDDLDGVCEGVWLDVNEGV